MCKIRLRYKHYGDFMLIPYSTDESVKAFLLLTYPLTQHKYVFNSLEDSYLLSLELGGALPMDYTEVNKRRRYLCSR